MSLDVSVESPRKRIFLKRVFYGWWVILASSIIASMGAGIYFYGFTTLFLPISKELGLTRASTSLVFGAARVEGMIEGPIVGWLIDRYGARVLIVIGILIFSAGYIAMYWMNSLLMFFLLYALVIAVGYQTGTVHTTFALTAKWFIRQRAKAAGVVSAAFGIGGATIVPVLGWLIIQFGWRVAVVIAGVSTLIVGLPLSLVIRSTPESKGLPPDGDTVENGAVDETSFTVREALKTPSFWILCAAFILRLFVVGGVWVHMVPLLVFKGFDEQSAANAIGLLLIFTLPARIGFGWLGDIYPKRYLLLLCTLIGVLALIILLTAQSMWQLYLFIIVFALGYGVGPLNMAIVGEYFGRKYFATIRGVMALVYAGGIISGPFFAGYIYDTTQSYEVAFITFIGVYFLAAIVFIFAKPPKPPARVTGWATS